MRRSSRTISSVKRGPSTTFAGRGGLTPLRMTNCSHSVRVFRSHRADVLMTHDETSYPWRGVCADDVGRHEPAARQDAGGLPANDVVCLVAVAAGDVPRASSDRAAAAAHLPSDPAGDGWPVH